MPPLYFNDFLDSFVGDEVAVLAVLRQSVNRYLAEPGFAEQLAGGLFTPHHPQSFSVKSK